MDAMDKARGILGEHMDSYVILAVSHDAPNTLQLRCNNRFAASGMVDRAIAILQENVVDEGWEIVWDTDDEEDNTQNE